MKMLFTSPLFPTTVANAIIARKILRHDKHGSNNKNNDNDYDYDGDVDEVTKWVNLSHVHWYVL